MPTSLVFFDCETSPLPVTPDRVAHVLKLGVARHYRKRRGKDWTLQSDYQFREGLDFADWLTGRCRKRSVTYCFAHNLQFDLLASSLLPHLDGLGWHLDSWYFKGHTSIVEWSQESRKLILLDSGNFFSGTLASVGEVLGMPKLPIHFATCCDAYLTTYCRYDVKILAKAVLSWLDYLSANDLGGFKHTLAGTAFNAWRHRFKPYKVHVHDDQQTLLLEEKSYHGGMVRAFQVGNFSGETFTLLDVNSMYPYVMVNQKFPCGWYLTLNNPRVSRLMDKLEKYAVVADVTLRTSESAFPRLVDDKLVYAPGEFRTVLTTPELQYLLDTGELLHIHRMSVYQQQPIFADYCAYFWERRLEARSRGDGVYDLCNKLMGNSLYGKFAQQKTLTKEIGLDCNNAFAIEYGYDAVEHCPFRWVTLNHTVYEQRQQGFSYHAFPAIAAHVTAYARLHLYRLILAAGVENVYHCDTDGLIVNENGRDRLKWAIAPQTLGGLKVERQADVLTVVAPKHYTLGTMVKSKGIRRDAVVTSGGRFRQQQFASLTRMLREGFVDRVFVDWIEKEIKPYEPPVILP